MRANQTDREQLVRPRAVSLLLLLLLIIQSLTLLAILPHQAHAFDLDLNAPIEELEAKPQVAPTATVTTPAPTRDAQASKERIRAMYSKIERLFKVLKVCDTKNFDLSKLTIPLNFSAENKAMMALSAVGKTKLVTSNQELYKRFLNVMGNCRQLAKAVKEKDEELNGTDSQVSGEEYQDLIARRQYELNHAPFEDIRSRFLHPGRPMDQDPTKTTTDTTTTTEKPSNLGIAIETVEQGDGAQRQMFQFL